MGLNESKRTPLEIPLKLKIFLHVYVLVRVQLENADACQEFVYNLGHCFFAEATHIHFICVLQKMSLQLILTSDIHHHLHVAVVNQQCPHLPPCWMKGARAQELAWSQQGVSQELAATLDAT